MALREPHQAHRDEALLRQMQRREQGQLRRVGEGSVLARIGISIFHQM